VPVALVAGFGIWFHRHRRAAAAAATAAAPASS
jgi:hypothetical protein